LARGEAAHGLPHLMQTYIIICWAASSASSLLKKSPMDKFERIAQANQVFTPGFPIHQKDLFSGRANQLKRTLDTLSAPGRHPVIFGQRGVGKTSLANILGQVLRDFLTVKISCDGSDTFATIWNRVLHTASLTFKQQALGFSAENSIKTISLGEALGHDPNITKPAEVADLFRPVNKHCVIILDEFDKLSVPLTILP
jgi:Cdc6-like AAA superfamily ATPase